MGLEKVSIVLSIDQVFHKYILRNNDLIYQITLKYSLTRFIHLLTISQLSSKIFYEYSHFLTYYSLLCELDISCQVMADEATDELAPYFNRETTPKILITSSDRPSSVSIMSIVLH